MNMSFDARVRSKLKCIIFILVGKLKRNFSRMCLNVDGHVCLFVRRDVVNIVAPTKYPY